MPVSWLLSRVLDTKGDARRAQLCGCEGKCALTHMIPVICVKLPRLVGMVPVSWF